MAPKLFQKPLTATVRERLKAARLEELKAHRAAPPTAQQIASVHRLPVQKAPESEPAEMAKKKRKHSKYDADFKARVTARGLKARDSGEETITAIAAEEGITETTVYSWMKKATEANGAPTKAADKPKEKSNLKSVTRELSEAMEHVAKLKKQLRKMLGDD